EVHLHADDAIALAGLAASTLHVEAEAARAIAAGAGLGHLRKQLAQRREEPGVGGRIRARRAADGTLDDVDDAVDVFQALDGLDLWRIEAGESEVPRDAGIERVIDQRGLARAGDSRDTGEQPDRNFRRDAL